MTGLREPPKQDRPSRVLARLFGLLLLASLAGLVIFATVTDQRVVASETRRVIDEERDTTVVGGVAINVFEDSPGRSGVVILHDDDVTGSLTLADVSASIGEEYRRVRIDLPGFGLSDRIASEGPGHTAAGMAETVAGVISERFVNPVIVVGVGFGGQVGADLALTYPNLVRGLVLVDVDFEAATPYEVSLQRLPWMGRVATYTWETGGRFALDNWAPFCDDGGWCPTADQVAARGEIISLQGTTDSINAFRSTLAAALAPSNMAEITSPVAYVWSSLGNVPLESIDSIQDQRPDMPLFQSDTYQAHVEEPDVVARAVVAVDS